MNPSSQRPNFTNKRVLYRVPTIEDNGAPTTHNVPRASAGPAATAPGSSAFIPAMAGTSTLRPGLPMPQAGQGQGGRTSGGSGGILETLAGARYGAVMESEWGEELEVRDEVFETALVERMLAWRFFCGAEGAATKSWLEWASEQMGRTLVSKGFGSQEAQRMVSYLTALLEKAAVATFTGEVFGALRTTAPRNFAVAAPKDALTAAAEKKAEKYEAKLGELKALKESEKRLQKEMAEWLEFLDEDELALDEDLSEGVGEFIKEVTEYLENEEPTKFEDAGVAEIEFFATLRKKNERAKLACKKEFETLVTEYKRAIEKSVCLESDELGMYEDIYEENDTVHFVDEENSGCFSANSSPAPNSSKTQRSPFFSRAFLARSSMAVLREETR